MSKTFFDEKVFENPSADQPWKKSETDRMVDEYLTGAHPRRIAEMLGRNPKAVKRRIEQFTYNERDRAVLYEPRQRISRRGKRFTENEKIIIAEHKARGVAIEHTAKILARDPSEFGEVTEAKKQKSSLAIVVPNIGVDVVLAHQCLYHFNKQPVIPDHEYDAMKEEELEFGQADCPLLQKAGKTVYDYPERIRHFALYLLFRHIDLNKVQWNLKEKKWVPCSS